MQVSYHIDIHLHDLQRRKWTRRNGTRFTSNDLKTKLNKPFTLYLVFFFSSKKVKRKIQTLYPLPFFNLQKRKRKNKPFTLYPFFKLQNGKRKTNPSPFTVFKSSLKKKGKTNPKPFTPTNFYFSFVFISKRIRTSLWLWYALYKNGSLLLIIWIPKR